MKPLTRRSVTTGSADAGRLAGLVAQYFAQAEAVNKTRHETDEELTTHVQATTGKMLKKLVGVPAPTARDALAALDFLVAEGAIQEIGDGSNFGAAVNSLVEAIQGYLLSQAPKVA